MRRGFKSEIDYNSTELPSRGMAGKDDAEKMRLRSDNAGLTVAMGIAVPLLVFFFVMLLVAIASKGH